MKLKRIITSFLLAISMFVTVAVADELPKYKLSLELDDGSVLEKDNIEYLEILLQNGENVSVIYLEKANNWKVETELNPGTYKIIIRNISPSKYLISNDYSVTISDEDIVSKISIKEFPTTSEEVNEKPKNSQEIENKEPIKEESKKQQQQTTSQTLKTRSIKLAITLIICVLAAAIIIIILWFISKIIR